MMNTPGSINSITESTFRHTGNVFYGQEGGPIYTADSNNYVAVGIATKEIYPDYSIAHKFDWGSYSFFSSVVGFKDLSMYQIDSTIKSEGVKAFQRYINQNLPAQYLGTPLAVDGGFGPATKTATIKLLQYWLNTNFDRGLEVDGGFGVLTRNALVNVLLRPHISSGMGVYLLQGALYGRGYDPKGLDGSFGVNGGTGCLNAVKYFQADYGLNVDGMAGEATLTTLFDFSE